MAANRTSSRIAADDLDTLLYSTEPLADELR
jgi:hypothetical protein